MKVSVSKSEVNGKLLAPSSKSYTIRGLMCAALYRGESEVVNPLISDDTLAAADVLSHIGVSIQREKDVWRVISGDLRAPDTDLYCGDSAATLRFMTAICSLIPGKCRLIAGPSLAKRPVEPLIQALRQLGVNCSSANGLPPVTVSGGGLKGGETELPGDISSQFVSALLLIAPLAERGMTIRLTTPLRSNHYVEMTLECLKKSGILVSWKTDKFEVAGQVYKPARYEVEGDWSSVSYFLALGAVSGSVEVTNLNPESLQGDRIMLSFLREMGATVEVRGNSVIVKKLRFI